MIKVLVTGANGQLGRSLASISEQYECEMYFADRERVDLQEASTIRTSLNDIQPDYIINCAAFTAVDLAESEIEKALAINHQGVLSLIQESKALDSKIIHISTDYVFNGASTIPYQENERIDPQSVYGSSKAKGEEELLKHAKNRSLIIRTSWLYSEFGHNFFKTMYRLGAEKEFINVVSDQTGTPTYAIDLAKAIMDIIQTKRTFAESNAILHFSNSGISNWYEFATEIMKQGGLDCKVNPIESSAYPTAAKRPSYSVLNIEKMEKTLGYQIRDWKSALEDCISRFKKMEK